MNSILIHIALILALLIIALLSVFFLAIFIQKVSDIFESLCRTMANSSPVKRFLAFVAVGASIEVLVATAVFVALKIIESL